MCFSCGSLALEPVVEDSSWAVPPAGSGMEDGRGQREGGPQLPSPTPGLPKLPLAVAGEEIVAWSRAEITPELAEVTGEVDSMKPTSSKGLVGVAAAREARGTSAAKSVLEMYQMANAEQSGAGTEVGGDGTSSEGLASGVWGPGFVPETLDAKSKTPDALRSTLDWAPGRPEVDRPVLESSASAAPATGATEATRTVERIEGLLVREAGLLRLHSPDSMAVVLRPDGQTELLVHLTQRDGRIEASVRCERGDFQQLGALWGQLQEALAGQKIQLAPLQEASGRTAEAGASLMNGAGFSGGGQSSRQPGGTSAACVIWPTRAGAR